MTTVEEAKEKQADLARTIQRLVENFEEDTGLHVSSINIRGVRYGDGREEIVEVNVEVKL